MTRRLTCRDCYHDGEDADAQQEKSARAAPPMAPEEADDEAPKRTLESCYNVLNQGPPKPTKELDASQVEADREQMGNLARRAKDAILMPTKEEWDAIWFDSRSLNLNQGTRASASSGAAQEATPRESRPPRRNNLRRSSREWRPRSPGRRQSRLR